MHPVILTWLKVEPGEQTPLAWSFAYFFCLLCGYYMLRPVRDEMAIEGGVQHLPWMMTGTFFTLLAATPVFGLLSSKLPRVRLLFSVYGFFVVNLLIFFVVMTAQWHPEWVARVFFVWLSVFNLFVVSVFWSFMADLFTPVQGARLFGVIAAGGSAGAIAGPVLTAAVTYLLPVATLMVWSALWLVACAACIYRLDRWSRRHLPPGAVRRDAGLGGGMWAGLRLVARSSYLLGICGYLFLLTMSATVLYLEQAAVIGREIPSPEARTRLFAGIDLAVNVLTFFTQVWVTNRLVMRFGLVAALLALPIASALGFIALESPTCSKSSWCSRSCAASANTRSRNRPARRCSQSSAARRNTRRRTSSTLPSPAGVMRSPVGCRQGSRRSAPRPLKSGGVSFW
jgi:AAA family ATP:ADP antiporter